VSSILTVSGGKVKRIYIAITKFNRDNSYADNKLTTSFPTLPLAKGKGAREAGGKGLWIMYSILSLSLIEKIQSKGSLRFD
jgi:hypothetical protein